MEKHAVLTAAANHFVRAEYRDRFVHEAMKKPDKLMARVCHRIDTVFQGRFRGGACAYRGDEPCMFFDLTGRQKVTTWRDAMDAVQTGGGGVLIIDESGRRFFAQAEGFPPPDSFAGDA